LERSLTHSRLIENEPQIARALALRSMLTRGRGANQEPMKFLSEAGEIVARGQYRTEAMFCLSACAGLLLDGGEADEAANAASVAQNVRQELGLVLDPVIEQFLSQVSNGAATSPAQAQGPASVFTYLSQVLERTSHLPPSA
jgi:ATP/maltotriose-dependent transcriptional regulator MalT